MNQVQHTVCLLSFITLANYDFHSPEHPFFTVTYQLIYVMKTIHIGRGIHECVCQKGPGPKRAHLRQLSSINSDLMTVFVLFWIIFQVHGDKFRMNEVNE